jgi:hypothetical protein
MPVKDGNRFYRGHSFLYDVYRRALNYHAYLPRALRIRAFDFLYDVYRRAPAYRMRFPKDTIDWDTIDAAMVG